MCDCGITGKSVLIQKRDDKDNGLFIELFFVFGGGEDFDTSSHFASPTSNLNFNHYRIHIHKLLM